MSDIEIVLGGGAVVKLLIQDSTTADFVVVTHVKVQKDQDVFQITIATDEVNLRIPKFALNEKFQFKSKQDVQKLAIEERAKLANALRPFESINVTWGADNPFLELTQATEGEVKLFLSQWLLGELENFRIAEFSIRSALKIAGSNTQFSTGFVCVLRLDSLPKLRIDLDDLNFSFPEFDLPAFTLEGNFPWTNNDGSARLLEKLRKLGDSSAVKVTIKPRNAAETHLALSLNNGTGLSWAFVEGTGQVDWNAPLLAMFDVEVTSNNSAAVLMILNIPDLTVCGKGDSLSIQYGQPSGDIWLLNNVNRSGQFGPLEYSFSGLSIHSRLPTVPETAITTEVSFERLVLRLVEDPQTFIVFKGTIVLTPSAASIKSLEIVEPFPITLMVAGAEALERGARAIATFLASLDLSADQLTQFLTFLGRFAAAVAKTLLFVGEALGAAANLVVRSLNVLAEGLIAIFSQLNKLTSSARFQIEVRLGLDPIELKQILITFNTPIPKQTLNGLGFSLTIQDDWQPGVLLDFVDNPGAYFIATRAQVTQDTPLVTLGTDLWLENNSSISHMPDSDPDNGNRPQERIITLDVKLKQNTRGRELIVIGGLLRGEAVFFKKLNGKLEASGSQFRVAAGQYTMSDLSDNIIVGLDFKKNRLLPLLGMGETGDDSGGGASQSQFLDKLKKGLGQVVWVEGFEKKSEGAGLVGGQLTLGIKAAGVATSAVIDLSLALSTLRVRLDLSEQFGLKSSRIEENALGLTWVIEQKNEEDRKLNKVVDMFQLSFVDGESGLSLNPHFARMELRFGGLSADGEGVVFEVSEFFVGRRGIDITAKVMDRAVRLNGLDVPFRFQTGNFTMRAGRLVEAAISGRGTLPPALVGEADCTLALAFAQDNTGIVLQSGKVEIDKKGEPIVCHSTRFTLTLTDLDVGIQKDGGYHLYFLVTGSLRFTPKKGEFEGGLLGFLRDVEINLERTPLTGDARVLARHISFQKALTPKKSVTLFNMFTFELRGFGFHPSCSRFDGQPAINLSGQIKFAEIGDVMQPKIDFHGLWIAAPKKGEALPRISAEGLGIDLQLAGSVKIRGAVLAVDPSTRTVEGKEFAPEGYNTYGFLGEGEVDIPGWGTLQASMGFLEVERKDVPGDRRKAFFICLQKDKLAVEIPTGFWTFYMREVGFGLGFRYTLVSIRDLDQKKSIPAKVRVLDDASKRQGDFSNIFSWAPEASGDRFTLALRAAFQAYPAQKVYNPKAEETAENPFFFDVVVAMRSDFTLLATLRGYLGVNYADFRANEGNFRERPGLRGYLYISAPRSELLARMIGDSKGFIGERFPCLQKGQVLRQAVESVDWSALMYIRPGLFHYELGWPDQLKVTLVDKPEAKITVRGGMIFRAADDGLLWGYNIEVDAKFIFSGSTGGSTGVALEGRWIIRFLARLLAYLSWQVRGSMVYALVSLDSSLEFKVRAWMEVDLGFKTFTLRTSFSFLIQISAAVEIAVLTEGVGARGRARIAVSVFGCTLSVAVNFAFKDELLDHARQRVQRYMSMSLTAEEPETSPDLITRDADAAIDKTAEQEQIKAKPPTNTPTAQQSPAGSAKPADKTYSSNAGRVIGKTDFWLVMHQAQDGTGNAYALLVPNTIDGSPDNSDFYASPPCDERPGKDSYTLFFNAQIAGIERVYSDEHGDIQRTGVAQADLVLPIQSRWGSTIPVDNPEVKFTLDQLFDECFLTSTRWEPLAADKDKYKRVAINRQEPLTPYRFQQASSLTAQDEKGRASERDEAQRQHTAEAENNMWDDRAHQARSTLMTLFLDQFVSFAKSEQRPPKAEAHVLDLGLMFYGSPDALEQLADSLQVYKHDQNIMQEEDRKTKSGCVKVLNPSKAWFSKQDPIFRSPRKKLGVNGFCLAWDLELPWQTDDDNVDPEHFLQYYEICRTIEGREYTPRIVQIKPAATMGGRQDEYIQLQAPDWQYTDDFTDLPPEWRRSLLPTSNETDALAAAAAWVTSGFGDDISLNYSVTPVDIAGTRGLEKSFSYVVERPASPVRTAEAEIRFVQTISSQEYQADNQPPKDMDIYIAISDKAWSGDTKPVEIPGYDVVRTYELVVEQEAVIPAGAYAAGGVTDKIQGLGSAGAETSSLRFPFAYSDLTPVKYSKQLPDELESDDETLKRFNVWGAIKSKVNTTLGPVFKQEQQKFIEAIWSNQQTKERVAARFWLRTCIEFRSKDENKNKSITLKSTYVAVACELSISNTIQDKVFSSNLRPEAFEWPVHLRLPPLSNGQVRVKSGFLHLRAPIAGASLSQWIAEDGASTPIKALRDANRRTVSHLEFDAVPDWESQKVNDLHVSSISGFDVHELDIDELAALDTKPEELHVDIAAWKRAKRVAHIELLTAEEAELVPFNNADWQSWQAHYPSETWRLDREDLQHKIHNGAMPTRRSWYSARETTPHFPHRFPRMRLLLQPPESAIADLMRFGLPKAIRVAFKVEPESPASVTLKNYVDSSVIHVQPLQWLVNQTGDLYTWSSKNAGYKCEHGDFTASALRYFLLCLCWRCPEYGNNSPLQQWRANPTALNGLTLELEAVLDRVLPERLVVSLPLDFTSPIHPILEETLSELSLSIVETKKDYVPAIYCAYEVMVQPEQPVDAEKLASFMASHPVSVDPYGWGVLHSLGLSATIRIYNKAEQRFLTPQKLTNHVNKVFSSVLARWNTAPQYDTQSKPFKDTLSTIQPFAEVLLKPGRDRVLRPFNSEVKAAEESLKVNVNGDGLAIIQLSLRPKPRQVWRYYLLKLKILTLEPLAKDQSLKSVFLEIKKPNTDLSEIDFLYPATMTSVLLEADSQLKPLSLPIEFGQSSADFQELELVVRCIADYNHIENLEFFCTRVVTNLSGEISNKLTPVEVNLISPIDNPADSTSTGISVYELFSMQAATNWAVVLKNHEAFTSLITLLRAVAPDFKGPEKDEDYLSLMAQYPDWAQRFLDHADAPQTYSETPRIALALAAPAKANPWRLAPDTDDCVSLYIPSDDRWAHVRAYAVQPVSRYAHIMAGVNVTTLGEREQLAIPTLPSKDVNIGHAVAVIDRTERIEPPVILGSSIQDESWEIVLARHGEESLAASNRPLFARLGKPDTLFTLLRAYRTPTWPSRLDPGYKKFEKPDLYPKRKPEIAPLIQYQGKKRELARLSQERLENLAKNIPALWKGAEVKSILPVPPQYKLVVAASARAGIVVSTPVVVLQEDLPRKAINRESGKDAHNLKPILGLVCGNGKTHLEVKHRLLSHLDVSPDYTSNWNESPNLQDICWWPDPDISYLLLHQSETGGVNVTEELADIRLVAEGEDSSKPVMVRTKGTRWEYENIVNISRDKEDFWITTEYKNKTFNGAADVNTFSVTIDDENAETLKQFVAAIKRFGHVLKESNLRLQLHKMDHETDEDYADRIKSFPQNYDELYRRFSPFYSKALGEYINTARIVLRTWLEQHSDSITLVDEFKAYLQNELDDRLKKPITCYLPIEVHWDNQPFKLEDCLKIEKLSSSILIGLWDIPSDDEIMKTLATGHALAEKNSKLWQFVTERVYSGATRLQLKTIDARAKMPKSGDPHSGVYLTDIDWPIASHIMDRRQP